MLLVKTRPLREATSPVAPLSVPHDGDRETLYWQDFARYHGDCPRRRSIGPIELRLER